MTPPAHGVAVQTNKLTFLLCFAVPNGGEGGKAKSPRVFLREKHGAWTSLRGPTTASAQSRQAHLDQLPVQSLGNTTLNADQQ